jgi:two-component system sensor kinase FixL
MDKPADLTKEQLIKDLSEMRRRISELEKLQEDKKKYEEELNRTKAMFEGLFEYAPDGILVVNSEGRIVRVNNQVERLFGYSRSELVDKQLEVLLPERFRERHVEHRRKYMAQPRTRPMGVELELYGKRKDGSEFHVDIALGPLQMEDELLVMAVIRDFTEQKLLEESRLREMLISDAAITGMQGIFCLIDEQGHFLRWNKNLEQASGFSAEEISKMHSRELFSGKHMQIMGGKANGVSSKGRFVSEVDLVSKDGRKTPYLLTGLRIEMNRQQWTVGIGLDITERKLMEENLRKARDELELRVQARTAELERRNRELQEFVFVASHDLKEPLRKIQTFGSLLEAKAADRLKDEERDYVARMNGAVNRMQELLDALLRYSRVDTNGQEFRRAKLDDVVRDAVTDLEAAIRKIEAHVEIDRLPTVMGDPSQLRHLFKNLIANSLKYHRPGVKTVIRIYGEENNGRCKISVEDNGIGFDQDYLEKIFQPFQRLHGRTEYPGTGVGLAICKKIAERHHGAITAKSTPGKGSTFIVTLPGGQRDR